MLRLFESKIQKRRYIHSTHNIKHNKIVKLILTDCMPFKLSIAIQFIAAFQRLRQQITKMK